MHRSFIPGLLLALLTACPAEPEPGDTQGATSDTCGTGNCETTAPTTTTTSGPADSTTLDCGTGDCCDVNPNFCEPTATSTGSSGSSSTGDDTGPGVEPPCGFGPTLEMLAMGKTEPTDCGTVTLDDDVAAWQAASDCAAMAAGLQQAFYVAFQLPSDDSLIFDGYYGTVGIVYGLGNLYTDTFGDPMLQSRSCVDVTTLDGCMLDVGVHCLECVEAGEVTPLECTM